VNPAVTSPRIAARLLPALVAARAVVPLAVRATSLPALLRRAPLNRAEAPVDVDDAVAVIEAFEAALRLLPRGTGTCLTRTLWRAIALRRGGIAVDVVLGVRKDAAGRPEGHAWLERDGAPFLERRPENLAHFSRAWCDRAAGPAAARTTTSPPTPPSIGEQLAAVDDAHGWTS
jgi:hypothetical protein